MISLRKIFLKFQLAIKASKYFFARSELFRLKASDVLMICHDDAKGFLWKNKAYSPLMDSLARFLEINGFSVFHVATPWSNLTPNSTFSGAIRINRQFSRSRIFSRFNFFLKRPVSLEPWNEILLKVKPKIVIAIQPSPLLNAACRNLKIKVFDLQHGVIEPSVYYNMELTETFGRLGLPDGCLCWDSYSREAFELAMPGLKAIEIGNLWIKRFKDPSIDDKLVQKIIRKKSIFQYQDKNLVLTLQWTHWNSKTIDIPKPIINNIKSLLDKGWHLLVRFHPVQIRKVGAHRLKRIWNSSTGIILDSKKVYDCSLSPLPFLFLNSKAHMTGYSASAIEASLMGIPSLLWTEEKFVEAWFEKYFHDNLLSYVPKTQTEFLKWFENLERIEKKPLKSNLEEIRLRKIFNNLLSSKPSPRTL